jgi:hypothetical protein
VFRTNADGCKCAKLFTDQTQALCIADWLSNGDITDLETALRAEAYLLSTLEVEYDNEGNIAEEYTLLSAAEISDVYSDGKDVLGETGWHYSRGHQGVNDGLVYECVIVTHKVVLEGGAPPTAAYRQADLFRIEFNLSGLTPTATLVHDEANVDWEPGANDFIFYPVITETESKLCYVDHAAAIVYDPRGAGAPIYAFYADGGLEVIRYTYSEGPLVTIPAPAVRVCGFGGRKETGIQYYGGTGRLSSITADYSGVSIGTQEPDNKFATHRYDEWQLVVAGGGSMDFTAGSRTQIRIWAAGDCNGLDVTGWPSSQINYAILFGTSQGYKTETLVRQASVIKIAIIPHGDSEAVYMTELVNGEITSQTRVRYEDWEIVDSRYKLTPNISMDKPSEGFGAVVDVPITPGLGVPGSQWWVINNVYFEDNVREVSEAGAPAGTGYKSCVSKLITSKGVITVGGGLSQDYDDWTEWPNVEILPGNCHPAATCWTQTSYFHGDSWFSSGPASSKVLYNGYDIATQPSTEFWRVVPLGWN